MAAYKPKSISVFFLAYNDEHTIGELAQKTDNFLSSLKIDYEIIVGNDASKDGTLKVLTKLKKSVPNLKIINNKLNLGYGGNLVSGLKSAKNEFVFYTDGDGQYDPLELKLLLDKLDANIDVVNGYKKSRADGQVRTIGGKLYARWLRFIFGIKIRDVDCDFRLIRRAFIDKIDFRATSGAICPELVIKLQRAGAKFAEVPVSHYPRRYGRSQFLTPVRVIRTFAEEYLLLELFHYELFRKFKFILVGCSSLMIQLTFFNLFLLAYKLKPTPATLLSDGFAILTSFFLNNAITFRDRRIRIRSETLKLVKSFLKYNYVVLVATLIQTGTVYFGTKIMGDSYLAAHFLFFLGILIGMVWNYKLHNTHVWPQKTATAASAQTYEK